MSDLALFEGGLPAHLRNVELDATTLALMGSSNTNYKRISIKGSVFRMIVNGQEVAKNEDRGMNIVIVAAAPKNARTFYSKTYVEGEALKPDCSSADGVTPDAASPSPQAKACASCPQNVQGSGSNGSRACRFSRRLAVMLENDLLTGDVYQLVLPAQSIFGQGEVGKHPLESYAKYLGSRGVSVAAVVTEMRFDTSSATPKLTFRAVRLLDADEYATAVDKGQSAEAQNAVSYDPTAFDAAKTAKPAAKVTAPTREKPDIVKFVEEEEAAQAAEPVKREAKKTADPVVPKDIASVLDDWE